MKRKEIKEKTIEEYIEDNITLDNYEEFIDKEWSENLQIQHGFIEPHPMLPFEVFVKLVIKHLIHAAVQQAKKDTLEDYFNEIDLFESDNNEEALNDFKSHCLDIKLKLKSKYLSDKEEKK